MSTNGDEFETIIDESNEKTDDNMTDKKSDDDSIVSSDAIIFSQDNDTEGDYSFQRLRCYLSLYLYKYQKSYLELYMDYIEKMNEINETLYESGEISKDVVLDSTSELAVVKAQNHNIENEEQYCYTCLKDNELDFNETDIEREKIIHDQKYYEAQNIGLSHEQIARYIADFQNAKSFIEAKDSQILLQKEKIRLKELLYEAGEITEIDKMGEEVVLKKHEFERAQYYLNMNVAYYYLERDL